MTSLTKEFDLLSGSARHSGIRIVQSTENELRLFYPKMDDAFSHRLSPLKTCERIRRCNPDNMWSIFNTQGEAMIGLYANIMLSPSGHKALLNGKFRPSAPSALHTATLSDKTDAIYTWAVLAPGRAALAIPMIAEKLRAPKYVSTNIYGNGMTQAGRRIMESLGFQKLCSSDQSSLYMYERLANRASHSKSPNSTKECNNV